MSNNIYNIGYLNTNSGNVVWMSIENHDPHLYTIMKQSEYNNTFKLELLSCVASDYIKQSSNTQDSGIIMNEGDVVAIIVYQDKDSNFCIEYCDFNTAASRRDEIIKEQEKLDTTSVIAKYLGVYSGVIGENKSALVPTSATFSERPANGVIASSFIELIKQHETIICELK